MKQPYKIKLVKTYQSVSFKHASCTYFTAPEYAGIGTKAPVVNLEEQEDGSVVVWNGDDMIKIGQANVAYIQYDRQSPDMQKPAKVAKAN